MMRSATVIQVNLETGKSDDLFQTQLPDRLPLHGGIHAMSGDLLAYAVYWCDDPSDLTTYASTYAILLLDLRAQNYVLIWHPRPLSFSSFVTSSSP